MRKGTAADEMLARIQVRANCSLSSQGALVFFAGTCAASLIVSGSFAWQGLWPVLPFAGLEMSVLGIALWLSMRRGRLREVITVYKERIVVEKGLGQPDEVDTFPRHWARAELRVSATDRRRRLLICSHGRCREVGGTLTEAERMSLRDRLVELVGTTGEAPAAT